LDKALYFRGLGHIVINGLGKKVGFLKHHSDLGSQGYCIYVFVIDILIVQINFSLYTASLDHVKDDSTIFILVFY